jgi:hypothetical protein
MSCSKSTEELETEIRVVMESAKEQRATKIKTLMDNYNCITSEAINNHILFEKYAEILKLQNITINPKKLEKLNLKHSNHTTKREIEINNNKRQNKQFRNRYLRFILLVIVLLTVFPILGKFDIIPKPISALIIFLCLVVIAIFIIFVFFIKDINRDINNFNEYNFHKPDDSQIALSRTNLKVSDSDRAKCDSLAELNEDIDPSNFSVPDKYKVTAPIGTSNTGVNSCK